MIAGLLREARPRQWAKNVLVFAAPGAAGVLDDGETLLVALVAFVAFCLVSSGTYFWNDVLDVEADRLHPTKRHRPIASGAVPVGVGQVVGSLLLVAGVALGFATGRWQTAAILVAYVVLTLSYSMEYGGLRGFVDDFFVRPAVRGRGVGAAGLAALEAAARARGVRALLGETSADTTAALNVYRRAGYVATDHLWLSRPLAPPVHEG